MLDYLRDVAIISACRKDRDVYDTCPFMLDLKEDLLREGYTPEKRMSKLDGWLHSVYIVPIIQVSNDFKLLKDISLKLFQDLARKYEQDTFIYGGILYDTRLNMLKYYTCATIYVSNTDSRNKLTKKLNKTGWISIERDYHLVLS